jgi:hypothetical protein
VIEINGMIPPNPFVYIHRIAHLARKPYHFTAYKVVFQLVQTLVNIANALGVTLDEIVYNNLEKSAHVSVKMIDDLLSDCSAEELKALAEVIKTTKNILRTKK